MVVVVPVFDRADAHLVRLVFGRQYLGAATAARVILFAAALQFVLGWSKSLPVSIGKPQLRIRPRSRDARAAAARRRLGWKWGVTGAALRARLDRRLRGDWTLFLSRLRGEVAAGRPRDGPS